MLTANLFYMPLYSDILLTSNKDSAAELV